VSGRAEVNRDEPTSYSCESQPTTHLNACSQILAQNELVSALDSNALTLKEEYFSMETVPSTDKDSSDELVGVVLQLHVLVASLKNSTSNELPFVSWTLA
jgi:hypothetical protein